MAEAKRWVTRRAMGLPGWVRGPVGRAVATAGGLVLAALLVAACGDDQPVAEGPPALPRLGAAPQAVTVSGLSSGAYMAGQMHIAYASTIDGAAIVAGGPYGCAMSITGATMPDPGAALLNLTKAVNGCMLDGMRFLGEPNVARLAAQARTLSEEGAVDPVADLKGDRVYLFTGQGDKTVVPAIVAAAAELYRALGLADEAIAFVEHDEAGHGFVTEDASVPCGETKPPFLNDCDYDQAGALLAHLLGPLDAPADGEPVGKLITFDQTPFHPQGRQHSLADTGLLFVPAACTAEGANPCRLHVAFHGCKQNIEAVGERFARETGLNDWAATNRLIVLYPQVVTTTYNSRACWDWWGYSGRDYLTRSAPQARAVKAMIDRLMEDAPEGGAADGS